MEVGSGPPPIPIRIQRGHLRCTGRCPVAPGAAALRSFGPAARGQPGRQHCDGSRVSHRCWGRVLRSARRAAGAKCQLFVAKNEESCDHVEDVVCFEMQWFFFLMVLYISYYNIFPDIPSINYLR